MEITQKCKVILAAGAVGLFAAGGAFAGALPGGSLDPAKVPKYVSPLPIPGMMPALSNPAGFSGDYYEIAMREFQQQILPAGFPRTTVWGYGNASDPKSGTGANASFSYPARSIEATVDRPLRVKWINDLTDANNQFLSHILPVDQTLHWANPMGDCAEHGMAMTDCRGSSPEKYKGPVPMAPHLHGAHVGEKSDGYPEAWFLPAASNLPTGVATEGKHYSDIFDGSGKGKGFAVYQYPNDQRASTLWFHDHSLGMTRLNVYAGPAGFYLLRGGAGDKVDDTRTSKNNDGILPSGAYEIPLLIQDRSFNKDGSLFFPASRTFFDGFTGPFIPNQTVDGQASDVSPTWNPEFFGNMMVVNGKTWPYLEVEPRKYRLRLLNGSDSRFLLLTGAGPKNAQPLTFWQIGADGGFLAAPEARAEMLLGPAERADVIIDFSAYRAGDTITLLNIGPDEPFGGGRPGVDFPPADSKTTGQVMQFRVVRLNSVDDTTNPANLGLPTPVKLGLEGKTRKLSLNEADSATVCIDSKGKAVSCAARGAASFGPTQAMLGILDKNGDPVPLEWMKSITELPGLNTTEIWEIYNFTMDAHPIHIHQVQFEILNRQALMSDAEGMAMSPATLVPGTERKPDPGESGRKDTVIVYPGEVARVKALFDIPGLFVWHCHILSHEDNEMMRPFCVGGTCQ